MCGIFIYSLVLKNRKGVRAHMTNKYDFNAYLCGHPLMIVLLFW